MKIIDNIYFFNVQSKKILQFYNVRHSLTKNKGKNYIYSLQNVQIQEVVTVYIDKRLQRKL